MRDIFDAAYAKFKENPASLHIEGKGRQKGVIVIGVHITDNWRALAYRQGPDYIWFWLGIHTDYDRMLKRLSK